MEAAATRSSAPVWDAEHYDVVLKLGKESVALTSRLRLIARRDSQQVVLRFDGPSTQRVLAGSEEELSFVEEGGELRIALPSPIGEGELLELQIEAFTGTGAGLQTDRDGSWFPSPVAAGSEGAAPAWLPRVPGAGDRVTSDLHLHMPPGWTALTGGTIVDSSTGAGRQHLHARRTRVHSIEDLLFVAGPRVFETTAEPLALGRELESFLQSWSQVPSPWPAIRTSLLHDLAEPLGGGGLHLLPAYLAEDERSRRDTLGDPLARAWARRWILDVLGATGEFGQPDPWWLDGLARQAELDWIDSQGKSAQATLLRADWHGKKQRAPMLFGQLRVLLGDAAFAEGLARFFGTASHASAPADALIAALDTTTTFQLVPFLADWIDSPGWAELEVSWTYDAERERVLLRVAQLHELLNGAPEAYQLPVTIHAQTASGPIAMQVEVHKRRSLIELPMEAEPLWLSFDPERRLAADVRERRGADAWLEVSAQSPHSLARAAAVPGLVAMGAGTDRGPEVSEKLLDMLAQDPAPVARLAAAQGLVESPAEALSEAVFAGLVRAANGDSQAQVRVAALRGLSALHARNPLLAPRLWPVVKDAVDDVYSWKTLEAALALGAAVDGPGVLALLGSGLPVGASGEEQAAALGALLATGAPRAQAVCLRLVGDESAGITARVAAVRGLGALLARNGNGELRDALVGALGATQPLVARTAAETLAELAKAGDRRAQETLGQAYPRFADPGLRRAVEAAWAR